MTFDGEHHFTWDAENRLVGVSPRVLITGSRTYSYEYDHMGRRVKKIEKRHAMAESDWVVHTFDYDAWNLLRERIQSADAMTTNQYTWGIDLSGTLAGAGGIGGLLAATLDGTNAFYTCDANGNITDLLAEDGALLAHYAYAPYGTPTAQSGPLATSNPFRFSTKYHDPETTLYYYGYRFYSIRLGRWLSRDPLHENLTNNIRYDQLVAIKDDSIESDFGAFLNNPITHVDTLGLFSYFENVNWRFLVIYEISGWLGSLLNGSEKIVEVEDGEAFPELIKPCYKAFLFIVQAHPKRPNGLSPTPFSERENPLRVFEYNKGAYGNLRYAPNCSITTSVGLEFGCKEVWHPVQANPFSMDGKGWSYQDEFLPALNLWKYSSMTISVQTWIHVYQDAIYGGYDEGGYDEESRFHLFTMKEGYGE